MRKIILEQVIATFIALGFPEVHKNVFVPASRSSLDLVAYSPAGIRIGAKISEFPATLNDSEFRARCASIANSYNGDPNYATELVLIHPHVTAVLRDEEGKKRFDKLYVRVHGSDFQGDFRYYLKKFRK